MMWLLTIIMASISTVGQSSFTKVASSKTKSSDPMYFNTLKVFSAFVLFLMISFYKFEFHIPTALFAAGYGLVLFFSSIFGYMALMNGSMALTSLLVSYSVIMPVLFGIIFLNEAVNHEQFYGIIMLLISMSLIKSKQENTQTRKCWFMYIAITFFCNGICSIIQKFHQMIYPTQYCGEFMIFSLFVTFVLFFAMSVYRKEEKTASIRWYAIIAGVLMGLGNYLTLLLSSKVNATVLFPAISIFTMICNVVVSKIYFKDTLGKIQLFGIVIGIISILLIK